jgi:hypothetical protein
MILIQYLVVARVIGFTICVNEALVLAALFVSPEYAAVIVWDPIDSEDELMEAVPPDSVTGDPVFTPSIANCTVPVAVFGVMVSVNEIDCPNVDGLADDDTAVVVVVIWFTVCVSTDEVLAASFVSPRYFVTMLCDPIDSDDVVNVAWPADIVPVPSIVLESLNCTVPVAVFGVIVAVNVTEWLIIDGFCDDASVVVVVARVIGFTICVSVLVLGASFVSPRYFATMLWDPMDNDCVVNVAWPDDIVPVPSIVLESLNCTVPVAVFGVIVAVNVTEWPNIVETAFELRTVEVDTGVAICPPVAKAE